MKYLVAYLASPVIAVIVLITTNHYFLLFAAFFPAHTTTVQLSQTTNGQNKTIYCCQHWLITKSHIGSVIYIVKR